MNGTVRIIREVLGRKEKIKLQYLYYSLRFFLKNEEKLQGDSEYDQTKDNKFSKSSPLAHGVGDNQTGDTSSRSCCK